jgi:patatin-like phospholipase/acyl hydrolase
MNKNFKILSIDGGGIRGIFPAVYLAEIEAELKADGKTNWQIYQNFDLLCGTSTGGILAIALSLGIPASDIVNLYYNNASKIFGNKKRFINQLRHSSHKRDELEKLIKEKFEAANNGVEPRFNDCKIPTCVTTYDLHDGAPSVLKSNYHTAFVRDYHIPAYKVALATSAAPTYFDPYSTIYTDMNNVEKPFHNKVDGGVFCNNPTLTAIIEAQEALGAKLEDLAVLSIGTGTQKFCDAGILPDRSWYKKLFRWITKQGNHSTRKNWGLLYWMTNNGKKPLIELFMQGQSQQTENLISLLQKGIGGIQQERFYYQRINTALDSSCHIEMDEFDSEKLNRLKEKASREFQLNGVQTLNKFFK